MPKGKPRTTAERKKEHIKRFGSLKGFSMKRKGKRK